MNFWTAPRGGDRNAPTRRSTGSFAGASTYGWWNIETRLSWPHESPTEPHSPAFGSTPSWAPVSKAPCVPDFQQLVDNLNCRNELVFAVDIPSGLNGRTGEPSPTAIRATRTGTLGCLKTAFSRPVALAYCGAVTPLPIGWPTRLTTR